MGAQVQTLKPAPKSVASGDLNSCSSWLSCGLFNCSFSAKVGSSAPGANSDDCPKLDLNSDVTKRTEEEWLCSSALRKFSFNDLKSATRNFRPDSLLGEGGFGHVFKGWVDEHGTAPAKPGTGLVVAVKILNQGGLQGHKEWFAEISYLGELHHRHLVKLIGFCIEDEQRLLVYEFMQKGSLENHLFRKGARPLPWMIRMKIAYGAAQGLAFLHGGERPVIFRDFKTSNVLLDLEFNAKVSDFGLAKDGPKGGKTHVSTQVMGTHGYAAPEYLMTGHLSTRSDIYSFGVVLLELLTGRRSVDKSKPNGEQNLVLWARPFLTDKRKVFRLVDPQLKGNYSVKGFQKAANLAARCLSRHPKARPSMNEVLCVLDPLQNLNDYPALAHVSSASPSNVRGRTNVPANSQRNFHPVKGSSAV